MKPTEIRAVEALGLGFDLASDFRLKFVKRCPDGGRLVSLDERNKRDVVIPGLGGVTIPDVPDCIRVDKGDHIRFKSDVLQFNQMSELLNQKSSVQGKIPSGYLNAIFDLTGAWLNDASDTKWLQTMAANPEAVLFKFVPITSLLNGIPGSGYLSHAINLYLRYKPALEDLQYFLDFQVPSQWAPLFCELPLRHQKRKAAVPSLQFSFFSPKIYVSSTQVLAISQNLFS
ncbi:unnamed protein product [Fraxinus pennsylvanica]|uniref:MACPF domain-containing protein n=1 Tax=Fraxinus pennsylvanica TaxID=56036 RepID=A0AAD2E3Y1_9LAMI|nr:unnamed protein product [Fraxinus pennsylvanica]